MTRTRLEVDPEAVVRQRFEEAGIRLLAVDRRDFPEETIFIARVGEVDVDAAVVVGNRLDRELQGSGFDGFVTVRAAKDAPSEQKGAMHRGVGDPRTTDLVNLLTTRSRTSEAQPSLLYIPDAAQNISTATAARHHLIFGRRGAGKTALMVETKRLTEAEGHLSCWVNIQTLRHEAANRAFLWVAKRLAEVMQVAVKRTAKMPAVMTYIADILNTIDRLIADTETSDVTVNRLIPRMQTILQRFLASEGRRLYIFIDELHYLPIREQPKLLDLVHAICRDCDAWMKVAAIRHLARWFQANPPLGLETGHDADHIDLDVTLENPLRAKAFLEEVLKSYAKHVGISSILTVFSPSALDRLVLASGAVPRDYLVLSANAVRQAQRRANAHTVGVQDVNKASGDAAKLKIAELEDDAASLESSARLVAEAAQRVRAFCIDEKKYTFFRVDFRDKESHSSEYGLLQSLMDLRLVHLVSASLSDEREAGRRAEVFMLDLSYFTSQRFKRGLRALDFEGGHIVLKETGSSAPMRVGDTPNRLLGLLRRGPLFELAAISCEPPDEIHC